MGSVHVFGRHITTDVGEFKVSSVNFAEAKHQLSVRSKVYAWVAGALLEGKYDDPICIGRFFTFERLRDVKDVEEHKGVSIYVHRL
jgi:hypothetical protein